MSRRMRECTRADDESPIPKSPSAAVSLPCISEAVPYPWNPLAAIYLSLRKLLSVQKRKSYCPKVAATWWYLCNCGLLERTHEQDSTQCSLLPPSWLCNWVKTTPPPKIVLSSSLLLLYKITIPSFSRAVNHAAKIHPHLHHTGLTYSFLFYWQQGRFQRCWAVDFCSLSLSRIKGPPLRPSCFIKFLKEPTVFMKGLTILHPVLWPLHNTWEPRSYTKTSCFRTSKIDQWTWISSRCLSPQENYKSLVDINCMLYVIH
jgi:hypothetical protein